MMKPTILCLLSGVLAAGLVSGSDLAPALKDFADYRYGGSKKALHDTRMAAFRGADDPALRQKNEQLLLEFVQSDATLEARREACLWLTDLATEASVPVLKKLAGQDDFSDVARMALDALEEAKVAEKPTSARGLFKARVRNSDQPLELLTDAMLGDDPRLARTAMTLVAEGVASKEACAWMAANVDRLSPERQVVAMSVMLRLDAAEGAKTIRHLSSTGNGTAKLAAIRNLGELGQAPDAEGLMKMMESSDEGVAEAAGQALLAMPEEAIRDAVSDSLKASDPEEQAIAITLAKTRGATVSADALLRIVGEEGNANRKAAAAALATSAPAKDFARVLREYGAAADSPVVKELEGSVWMLARRQTDYRKAAVLLRSAAGESAPSLRPSLEAMAKKLETLVPETPLDQVRVPPASAAHLPGVLLPGKRIRPLRSDSKWPPTSTAERSGGPSGEASRSNA